MFRNTIKLHPPNAQLFRDGKLPQNRNGQTWQNINLPDKSNTAYIRSITLSAYSHGKNVTLHIKAKNVSQHRKSNTNAELYNYDVKTSN